MLLKSEKIDLRILRTRRLIVEAFKELMNEKGIDSVTVRDIAEHAMINRATFYAHFSDKYDLFGFIIRDSFLDYLATKLPKGTPFSVANIRILTTAVYEYVGNLNSTCHQHPRAQYKPIVESQVQHQLYEMILAWIKEASPFNVQTKPESCATLMSWLIFGAGIQWNRQDAILKKEEIVDEVMVMIRSYLNQPTPS